MRKRGVDEDLTRDPKSDSLLDPLLGLPVNERLDLVEAIWDGILAEGVLPRLTPEQREDVGRRLDEANANPRGGVGWPVAREWIERGPE